MGIGRDRHSPEASSLALCVNVTVEPEGLEYNLEMEDEEWLKGHKM